MLIILNSIVYFDQITHHSAGNDQLAFHTLFWHRLLWVLVRSDFNDSSEMRCNKY